MAQIVERRESSFGGIIRLFLIIFELLIAAAVLILGTAFVLGFLGANPNAEFASWIYDKANSLMQPFNGLFDPITLSDGSVIHTSLLFAMLVYALIGAVVQGIARRF